MPDPGLQPKNRIQSRGSVVALVPPTRLVLFDGILLLESEIGGIEQPIVNKIQLQIAVE